MTDFVVTIVDQEQLDGITWAREEYNKGVPLDPETGEPSSPQLATDQEYVQWVMDQAASSYAQQKIDAEWRAAYEAANNQRSRATRGAKEPVTAKE